MWLHTFRTSFLTSWNIKQDTRIQFLMSSIGGDINSLLDGKWNIDCIKIDSAIVNNSFWLSQDTLSEVKNILNKVRSIFLIQWKLGCEIDKCQTFEEMLHILKKYWKSLHMNSFLLNKVISQADNLEKALKVIAKYGKWIEINLMILNSLFKLSHSLEEKKELLEIFWKGKEIDIFMLNMMLAHSENLASFQEIIYQYWEWLSGKSNPVTLMILLKLVIKWENCLDKKTSIFQILNIVQQLPEDFNDTDKISFWKFIFSSKKYTQDILDYIRNNKIERLYYVLPEERGL